MKTLKILLTIGGLVAIIGAIKGFVSISNANTQGIGSRDVDTILALSKAMGITQNLSFADRLSLFCAQERVSLAIGGGIAFLVGLVIKKK